MNAVVSRETLRDFLLAIRRMMAIPDSFSKYAYAKNAAGLPCYAGSDEAVSWCLEGALYRVEANKIVPPFVRPAAQSALIKSARKRFSFHTLSGFNDAATTTHDDILWVLDDALAGLS